MDNNDDESLGRVLRAHAQYHHAPEELRLALERSISVQVAAQPAARSWFDLKRFAMPQHSLALGVTFMAGVLAALLGVLLVVPKANHDDALIALAGDHARALVTGTDIDVASSDRHTVKPWISRELGVSPSVIDLVQSGYPLRGARRGYLEGTAVATLVYSYKQHLIDVYALPATMQTAGLSKGRSVNGFHCITFSKDGFTMIAISDVDELRLADFVRLLQSPPLAPASE
jgi:anti-sigma factor RsiW